MRRRSVRAYDTATADESFDAVTLVRRRPGVALPALGYAACIDVLGAAMLWATVS
jgi:hypothetical protein